MTSSEASPSDCLVREAVPGDAEAIVAYVRRLTEQPDVHLPYQRGELQVEMDQERRLIQAYAEADNSVFLVAEVDGRVVGLLDCKGGTQSASRHVVAVGVSVDRTTRGQGVGTALMRRAVQWARDTGIVKRMELSVFATNAEAIALYRKCGFEEEGRLRRSYFKDGEYIDAVLMGLLI